MRYISLILSKIKRETIQTLPFRIGLGLFFIIALSLFLGLMTENKLRHFGEGGLVMWASVIQLLILSWLSYCLYKIRKSKTVCTTRDYRLWLLFSLGFLFLSADEFFMIHESIDKNIHTLFHMTETGLSDRIDDILIGIYGLIGIGFLYYFKNEVRLFKPIIIYLGAGFEFGFLSVILDIITNGDDIIQYYFHKDFVIYINFCMIILEESFKLFAEYFFIVGLCKAIEMVQK